MYHWSWSSSFFGSNCCLFCYLLPSFFHYQLLYCLFPLSDPLEVSCFKPLHKGENHATPSNNCPISLLPITSKLLEKHVHHQLSCHLLNSNLLFPLQSGFCPIYSTQTLLLHCLDNWYKDLDSKQYIGMVFLVISKAFDTINHDLLLSELDKLGLSPLLFPGLNPTIPLQSLSCHSGYQLLLFPRLSYKWCPSRFYPWSNYFLGLY